MLLNQYRDPHFTKQHISTEKKKKMVLFYLCQPGTVNVGKDCDIKSIIVLLKVVMFWDALHILCGGVGRLKAVQVWRFEKCFSVSLPLYSKSSVQGYNV